MLTIKNIDKIIGTQVSDKWEVYETDVLRDGSGYVFVLSDWGYYKHSRWYFTLDRNIDPALNMFKLHSNRNGICYDYLIRPKDISPVGLIYYMNCIIAKVNKDEYSKQSK
jgi:hypothetical protein